MRHLTPVESDHTNPSSCIRAALQPCCRCREANVGEEEATTLGQYQWPPHSCPAIVPEEGEGWRGIFSTY
jgi:hypothetical protein